MLQLRIEEPFEELPRIPETSSMDGTKNMRISSGFGYTVKESELSPWPDVPAGASGKFHVADRKFGWIGGSKDVQTAKRLVESLLLLGAVPDFTRIDEDCNFRFFFNVSSERIPAYYELTTLYGRSSCCQEIHVAAFCRHTPDEDVVRNIVALDETLCVLFRIHGIPLITW